MLEETNGIVKVAADQIIREISFFDISGIKMCSHFFADEQVTLSKSELNLTKFGMYVVRIVTDEGIYVKKLYIRQ